jgi:hypothetical protein
LDFVFNIISSTCVCIGDILFGVCAILFLSYNPTPLHKPSEVICAAANPIRIGRVIERAENSFMVAGKNLSEENVGMFGVENY